MMVRHVSQLKKNRRLLRLVLELTKQSSKRIGSTLVGLMVLIVITWLLYVGGDQAKTGGTLILEEPPRFGLYYDRFEPAFYTGFAPRTNDPRRLHLHVGRGNQLRVTVVLAPDVLHEYAGDLLYRYRTYRTLIAEQRVVLTQNQGFEEFERRLKDARVEHLVEEEAALSDNVIEEHNLQLLTQLNPGRVFRIHMPVDELLRRWVAQLRPSDRTHMDRARQLELVNLMLPTRLFVDQLNADGAAQLEALVKHCPEKLTESASLDVLRPAFLQLLQRVSHGIYPVRDGQLQFAEFTAIYPVGTFNQYTTYHGRQIPEYPTPGRRALTTHQRTLTIDHVPTDTSYSYFPWLPYMHVGSRLHNAVHTLPWQMKPNETTFLPPAWRSINHDGEGKPYEYLWLLSRGPMSHGCTHLNAGHISELRQLLPAETDRLDDVDLFINKSYLYDVFDIDGDFEPEVIGVRYFIAYSLKQNRPDCLRVRDERHAFYDWLYGGELAFGPNGQGVFHQIKDCRFIERTASDGSEYQQLFLREADYEPEKIQFYRFVDVQFARELRKIGVRHPFPNHLAQLSAPQRGKQGAASAIPDRNP
jgi:hypothetical protein